VFRRGRKRCYKRLGNERPCMGGRSGALKFSSQGKALNSRSRRDPVLHELGGRGFAQIEGGGPRFHSQKM